MVESDGWQNGARRGINALSEELLGVNCGSGPRDDTGGDIQLARRVGYSTPPAPTFPPVVDFWPNHDNFEWENALKNETDQARHREFSSLGMMLQRDETMKR
jgi:hypothetical protein